MSSEEISEKFTLLMASVNRVITDIAFETSLSSLKLNKLVREIDEQTKEILNLKKEKPSDKLKRIANEKTEELKTKE